MIWITKSNADHVLVYTLTLMDLQLVYLISNLINYDGYQNLSIYIYM